MSGGTPLFDDSRYAVDDITASRHKGAETSEDAHASIRESKEQTRRRILGYLAKHGARGGTWYEISEALGISYQNSGRVSELKRDGRVVESGARRPTPSGRDAFVVVLPQFARTEKALP